MEYLLNVYSRLEINFTHGEGVWLFDQHANRYLDLIAGLGVTILGHNHPKITSAICQQAAKLIHSSNMVQIPKQEILAKMLVHLSGIKHAKVFFNNSGAEAVETAIKLIRLYGHSKNINNPKIIVMEKAFHGRTIATLSASDNIDIQQGFEPLLDCFIRIPFNDLAALNKLTTSKQKNNIVAVLLEPIQGEAGIKIPDPNYLKAVREICSANNWLMVLDEIQSGIGRTGKLFCYQHYNIIPDVISIAKGLANGIPIGACIINESLANLFKPKSHGSTFGGNQLACTAAISTLEEIVNHKLYEQAAINGAYFLTNLQKHLANNHHIVAIRGQGLMIGIELDIPCREILPIALQHGLFFNITRQSVIRLLPPLIIEKHHIDLAIEKLVLVIKQFLSTL
ncbi:MAG: aspartate aminotransferase family protein [Gammaproteobacteria bacterium]